MSSPSSYSQSKTQCALYQLHLVKAETAKAFIPKEFRLVEAFGYTLGGFFLASYDDSPAGTFDELVVIAGIVWNPPTSCAWAARVLVNSDEACIHGRKDIGLPSQVAKFSKTIKAVPKATKSTSRSFLDTFGAFVPSSPKSSMDIQVTEIKGLSAMNLCNINLSMAGVELSSKWMGPHIKMSLPSFSGRTKYNSDLLKYSCEIECRVRAVAPAKVLALSPPLPASGAVDMDEEESTKGLRKKRNLSISVLLSKPIFALEFNCLKMKVEPPKVISTPPKNSLRH
ncbi:OLC1v1028483C1 [Oldenlandia corymbosa var. corymbosa]|uniref:OLC1v1028483C1 n=1 Tax=Oldenlandia corymbosa var. corymbosa TaxID=529605 RepID=A0AAV1CDQ7_OLDCO|nr:OLC1v1028483C1 [Oldenlandia corymbosa var. corymbosa]